jgi:hypothetical protein
LERNDSGVPVGVVDHHGLDPVKLEEAGQFPPFGLKHGAHQLERVPEDLQSPRLADLLTGAPKRLVEDWILTEWNERQAGGAGTGLCYRQRKKDRFVAARLQPAR